MVEIFDGSEAGVKDPSQSLHQLLSNGWNGVARYVKLNLSTGQPFLSTNDLYLLGLKLILANVMSYCKPWRICLVPDTENVVMVRPSMKVLIRGCLMPDFVLGSLRSTSADLATVFMARAERVTEMVHPVMIPLSSQCQLDVLDLEVTLTLQSL